MCETPYFFTSSQPITTPESIASNQIFFYSSHLITHTLGWIYTNLSFTYILVMLDQFVLNPP
jgi:hypothetical protein